MDDDSGILLAWLRPPLHQDWAGEWAYGGAPVYSNGYMFFTIRSLLVPETVLHFGVMRSPLDRSPVYLHPDDLRVVSGDGG